MLGIRSNVRAREITSVDTGAYYYGSYGYGRYGVGYVQGMRNDMLLVEQQRGIVRAQEKGSAATSIQEIKANLVSATADIRRKMTEKYKAQIQQSAPQTPDSATHECCDQESPQ
jgi:hypothetical protein